MRRTSQVAQWKEPPNGKKWRKGTCALRKPASVVTWVYVDTNHRLVYM